MPKILFTENAELKRGDGSGPRFDAGKVYLLPVDACERWKRRNKAVAAPDDALAVNEPAPKRPSRAANAGAAKPTFVIVEAGEGLFNVAAAVDGVKVNDKPLPLAEAEALLAEKLKPQTAAS
jgi:hypothetical protein